MRRLDAASRRGAGTPPSPGASHKRRLSGSCLTRVIRTPKRKRGNRQQERRPELPAKHGHTVPGVLGPAKQEVLDLVWWHATRTGAGVVFGQRRTESSFAPRKYVLSRSERRHLFPKRPQRRRFLRKRLPTWRVQFVPFSPSSVLRERNDFCSPLVGSLSLESLMPVPGTRNDGNGGIITVGGDH
jgi:hypothetical protein